MIISIIVAYTKDEKGRQIIGKDGDIPWKIPGDMKWFRENTLDCAVVMGRKTHESIGRILTRRDNIILSRDPSYEVPGAFTFTNLDDALDFASIRNSECFIIGGEKVYEEALPKVDRMYITYIRNNPGYAGDTFFPQWERHKFIDIHKEYVSDPVNGIVSFKIFQRGVASMPSLDEVPGLQYSYGVSQGEGV